MACSVSPKGHGISLHSVRHYIGLAPAVRGRGRTGRAIGLPVRSVGRESGILVNCSRASPARRFVGRCPTFITKIEDFRTTTVDRLKCRRGWIESYRHPIPCCRGRGTVSTVRCVSAGRTPSGSRIDFGARVTLVFDPGGNKPVESGVKVDAIHARRQRRDSLAVIDRARELERECSPSRPKWAQSLLPVPTNTRVWPRQGVMRQTTR